MQVFASNIHTKCVPWSLEFANCKFAQFYHILLQFCYKFITILQPLTDKRTAVEKMKTTILYKRERLYKRGRGRGRIVDRTSASLHSNLNILHSLSFVCFILHHIFFIRKWAKCKESSMLRWTSNFIIFLFLYLYKGTFR